MGTIIWLIFTTAIGYLVGHFWFSEYVLISSVVGFFIGLFLRFFAGGVADVAGDLID